MNLISGNINRRNFVKYGAISCIGLSTYSANAVYIINPFFGTGTGGGGGGSCNTLRENVQTGAAYPSISIQGVGGPQIANAGTLFTPTGTYTACKAEAYFVGKDQTPTWNLYAAIFTNTGAGTSQGPGVQSGTRSDLVSASSISSGSGFVTFSNLSVNIVSGLKCWFCLISTGDTRTPGDNIYWQVNNDYTSNDLVAQSTGIVGWELFNNFDRGVFKLYSS